MITMSLSRNALGMIRKEAQRDASFIHTKRKRCDYDKFFYEFEVTSLTSGFQKCVTLPFLLIKLSSHYSCSLVG